MQKGLLLIGAVLLMAACAKENAPEPGKPLPPPEVYTPWLEEGMETATYINNGKIQIGVDMTRGGSIFHFSEVNTKYNLLNHVDEGRFVQQSYYGEPDGSTWNGQPWVWNPIQGGGSHGEKAKVLSSEVNPTSLKVRSEPVLWASGKPASECVMIEEIELQDRIAHIHYVMSNRGPGAKDHPSTDQEVPAIFADWDLKNHVFYGGDKPWTGDKLTTEQPPRLDLDQPSARYVRTEHWAAYINDEGWGLGVYTPGSELSTVYRFGSGPAGPKLGSCSYFAPLRIFAIEKDGVYAYDVYMMIGQIDEIRAAFYKIHAEKYSE